MGAIAEREANRNMIERAPRDRSQSKSVPLLKLVKDASVRQGGWMSEWYNASAAIIVSSNGTLVKRLLMSKELHVFTL